ncbi:hypothetical protein Tco_0451005 [Tanacetum coccineum]
MPSDSASSEVTYTSISSHGDPPALTVDLFGLQKPDSPEAAPKSPDYVPGPKEPEQAPPSPNYVPALSLGYIADSDPEEDSEDGRVDYPANRGDDDDDDDSFDDNEEEEEVSKEEHLAPADSIVAPVVDPVPSSEETEPFETDESAMTPPPPPVDHTTPLGARISVLSHTPMFFPSEAEVERLLALPTPPPSPLISLSQRLARCLVAPVLPSSPLPRVPHPYGIPNHVCAPRGFRATIGILRASSPSTNHPLHPSPPLPALPASLFIPPPINRKEDIPEAKLPTRRPAEAVEEVAPTTLERVNARVTKLAEGQFSAALGQIQALQARDLTHVDDPEGADSSSTARTSAAAAVAATAPMTAATVEQLIEARVSKALANHETLRNSINGYGDGSHNSDTGIRGTMESVFHISNCAVENQVKFSTCTFLGNALTCWNSHIKTVTQVVAYAMDWKTLKKKMIVKYCPRELALMYGRMFPEESDEVERYVGVLPDIIRGNVIQGEYKRKLEFNAWNNQGYQQQNKRHNTRRAYIVGPGERKEYTGSLPMCTKCSYHHKGPCAPKCNKCKKISHLARDCRSSGPNGNNNNHGNSKATQNAGTCYEYGIQGHFKRDCKKLKNRN